MPHDIAMASIFFGGALCFLLALEQVTGKDTGRISTYQYS